MGGLMFGFLNWRKFQDVTVYMYPAQVLHEVCEVPLTLELLPTDRWEG